MIEKYDRRFEGVWIPRNIWLSESLTLQEKAFLVEIKSLDNEHGCFASNEHFSKFFQLSKSRCSEVINKLKDKNLIALELMYIPGTRQVEKRIIRVNYGHEIFLERGIRNLEGGIREVEGGIRNPEATPSEKAEDNNTVFNNTSNNSTNNTTDKQSVNQSSVDVQKLTNFFTKRLNRFPSEQLREDINFYLETYNDADLIIEAFNRSLADGRVKAKEKYALGTLRNWKHEGVTSIQLLAKKEAQKLAGDQGNDTSNGYKVELGF